MEWDWSFEIIYVLEPWYVEKIVCEGIQMALYLNRRPVQFYELTNLKQNVSDCQIVVELFLKKLVILNIYHALKYIRHESFYDFTILKYENDQALQTRNDLIIWRVLVLYLYVFLHNK